MFRNFPSNTCMNKRISSTVLARSVHWRRPRGGGALIAKHKGAEQGMLTRLFEIIYWNVNSLWAIMNRGAQDKLRCVSLQYWYWLSSPAAPAAGPLHCRIFSRWVDVFINVALPHTHTYKYKHTLQNIYSILY